MAEPESALPTPFETDNWPAQGEWTWNDYLRLPDDGLRYEIIEGVLYATGTPTFDHQFSVSELASELHRFAKSRQIGLVLVARFDIRLIGIADPVEPDIMFFRKGNEPQTGDEYFQGVPDLLVEVLSSSTRHVDRGVKLDAYEKAGIPEYWLVDRQSCSVTVYSFEHRQYGPPKRFGLEDDARSIVLPGFETEVAALFPPARP